MQFPSIVIPTTQELKDLIIKSIYELFRYCENCKSKKRILWKL